MEYLLDANAVIALLNKSDSRMARQARRHQPTEVGISSIVAHELYYGAFKSQRTARNVALVDALQFEVMEFDQEDARHAGEAARTSQPSEHQLVLTMYSLPAKRELAI
jgi:tRNA(fMet)-specific endonuclease VapC